MNDVNIDLEASRCDVEAQGLFPGALVISVSAVVAISVLFLAWLLYALPVTSVVTQ